MKVLVIGDSQDVVKDISFCLHLRWPDVIIVSTTQGSNGIELLEAEAPDLVMVDFSLPDMNGLDLVGKVREFSDVPLTILTGGTEADRAKVLEAGADDYIVKPLSAIDVLAKVNALLRRTHAAGFQRNHMPLVRGSLVINSPTREVFLHGAPVKLTPHEYDLLFQLVRNEGRVLSHCTLLEKVWGLEYARDLSFLKKYIYRLRQKLHDDASLPQMILTERGVGYRFTRRA